MWSLLIYINVILLINVSDSRVPFGIIGGTRTNIAYLPYQLAYLSNGNYRCGASLISNDFALTAGHCVLKFPINLSLRAGSTYKDQGGVIINVQQTFYHPYYVPVTFQNDFALLYFEKPITFTNVIQPVKLPTLNTVTYDGTTCNVAGWGKMENNKLSADLKSTNVQIVNQYVCQANYNTYYVRLAITNEMICAGSYYGGNDGNFDIFLSQRTLNSTTLYNFIACTGDSGSGLVCNGILTGVVSSGYSCGLQFYPGIYGRVVTARNWIYSIASI